LIIKYSKIPLIRRPIVSAKIKLLLFTRERKSFITETGRYQNMFKNTSKSVCTSTAVVSPDPLSPIPTSSAMKTPVNTEKDPEPADDGNI
jgi:hypothetical protein